MSEVHSPINGATASIAPIGQSVVLAQGAQVHIQKEEKVQVQLKNGQWKEATLVGGLYHVELAKGVKIYTQDDIKQSVEHNQDIVPVEKEKEGRMLYHYMVEMTRTGKPNENGEKEPVTIYKRVISNVLPDNVKSDYHQSVITKKPSNSVLAINTGNYKFRLLEQRVVHTTRDFTIVMVAFSDIAKVDNPIEMVKATAAISTSFYANASYVTFMQGAGFKELGLKVINSKKTAKRLQEITRMAELSHYTPRHRVAWKIRVADLDVNSPIATMPAEFTDGMSYMTVSAAIKVARQIEDPTVRYRRINELASGAKTRFTIRYNNGDFLAKGDVIVVPDHQLKGVDIITMSANLKKELTTNGFALLTLLPHEPRHTAVWDTQSTTNFGVALTEDKEFADLKRILDSMKESITNGEIPPWLLLGEGAHNDDGTPNMDKLSDQMNRGYIRAQVGLGDITFSQNYLYMALNGLSKRLSKADRVYSKTFDYAAYKKTWIPMTNAVLGAVVTYESAVHMGGFTFPNEDGTRVFWDDRLGLVIPGNRFLETYHLHGGWDLDDSVKAIWIRLWASGNIDIHRGSTIPSNMVVPSNAADARDALLLVRSPNGPGEYSIEEFNADGMFDESMINLNQVVTVDLSAMPLPQHELLKNVTVAGMPTSTVYSGAEMTTADMMEMVFSQMENPGIGRFCNAIMVYFDTVKAFPTHMLEVMETIVDTCQQGYDLAAFRAIEGESTRIWWQLHEQCTLHNLTIDKALAVTRMPVNLENAEGKVINFHKLMKKFVVEGRFTRIQSNYNRVINAVDDLAKKTSMMWRWNSPLVSRLRRGPAMSAADQDWARKFYHKFNVLLTDVDSEWATPRKANSFQKLHYQQVRGEKYNAIVDQMVKYFTDLPEEERYYKVVTLYKWIAVTSADQRYEKRAFGISDRVVFQPNSYGKLCVMDILIEAVKHYELV